MSIIKIILHCIPKKIRLVLGTFFCAYTPMASDKDVKNAQESSKSMLVVKYKLLAQKNNISRIYHVFIYAIAIYIYIFCC